MTTTTVTLRLATLGLFMVACSSSPGTSPPVDAASSSGGSGGGSGGAGGRGGSGGGGSGGTAGAPGTGGSGGSATGGSGGSSGSGGSGGSATGGSGGAPPGSDAAAGGTGGAGGSAAGACGMGRKTATGAVIENFDGMTQVLEWLLADRMNTAGTRVMPTGSLTVPVTGPDTLAVGALASYAAMNRPCMDGSAFTGIQFSVTGTVTSLHLRIGTPATYPLTDGGNCESATLCAYAHYDKDVSASLPAGGVVRVNFADLRAPFGMPAAFDKSALISLVFLTLDPTTTHSFTVDNISFF
jgi:hypothetical protein